MRALLLTTLECQEWKRPTDYFTLRGWERILEPHECRRVAEDFPAEEYDSLRSYDVALRLGDKPHRAERALRERGVRLVIVAEHPRLSAIEPEWFVPAKPLSGAVRRPVFCGDEGTRFKQAWREASAREACLLMPLTYEAMRHFRAPGPSTLFAPYFPEAHLSALASASYVVTGDEKCRRVAAGLGIPVRWLGEPLDGSPQLSSLEGTRALVTEALGLETPPPRLGERAVVNRLDVACLFDWPYLPQFLGLAANLRDVHPGEVRFHVLALDARTSAFLAAQPQLAGGQIYSPEALWTGEELARWRTLGPAQRAYCAKPEILRRVIAQVRGPVLYSDLDLFFFEDPTPWLRLPPHGAIKFCRQHNETPEQDRRFGHFQAGLIAANENAQGFLEWWSRLVRYRCEPAGHADYFLDDQGYLDLAPILFAEFAADDEGRQNVAPWNLSTLGARPDEGFPWRPALAFGKRAASFHASYADRFSFAHAKSAWDATATFFSACDLRHAPALVAPTAEAQAVSLGPLCRAFQFEAAIARRLKGPRLLARFPHAFYWLWKGFLPAVLTPCARAAETLKKMRLGRTPAPIYDGP